MKSRSVLKREAVQRGAERPPTDAPPSYWSRRYIESAEAGKLWLAEEAGEFLIPETR